MNKLFKHILTIVMTFVFGLTIVSCGTTNLETPTNLELNGSILTFNEVANASKYRIVITSNNGSVMKRFVESGVNLNDLNIPEGVYQISVQALNSNNEESSLSNSIEYVQKDLYMIKEIKGDKLIDGEYIKWMGRTYYDETNMTNTMYYSASGFSFKVKKDENTLEVKATITGTNTNKTDYRPYIVLVLDNNFDNTITKIVTSPEYELTLVGEGGFSIDDNNVHTISLYKRSESIDSHIALKSLNTNGKFVSGVEYKDRKIEVIAASSSTGYGNLGNSSQTKTTANSDALKGFAFRASQMLDSEINIVSASGWGIYASRWTTPKTINMHDQYKYVDVFSDKLWDTNKYIPDVIVTNFGTNDDSYIKLASNDTEKKERTEAFINTYVDFISKLHSTYPNAKIIILYGLMGETSIFDNTLTIYNNAKKIVPDLEIIKIDGDAKGCAAHPSASSHELAAVALSNKIKEMMGW